MCAEKSLEYEHKRKQRYACGTARSDEEGEEREARMEEAINVFTLQMG